MDWHLGRLNYKTAVAKLHRHILWLQPDQTKWSWLGEDFICHQPGALLLQSDVVRTQECRCHISKANEQDVLTSDWKERASLRGRHAGKKHTGGQPLERPLRDIWHITVVQHEVESKQVCVRGNDREVPGIHGILNGYWGQPEKDTGYNGVSSAKDGQGGIEPEWKGSRIEQVRLKSNG